MHLKTLLFYGAVMCCWGNTFAIPQHLIDEFKSTFLTIFDLKNPPKLDRRAYIPEALQRMYENQNAFPYDTASLPLPGYRTGSANTVRSFGHVESPIDQKFAKNHRRFFLKFNVSSIPKIEKLKAAEIMISRESLEAITNPFQQIVVHDILQPGIKGVDGPITRVIDSKTIDTRKNTSISVTVFDAVERWLESPKSNYGLLIVVHTFGAKSTTPKKHLRLRRDADDWHQKQPLLFTFTDDGKNRQRTGEEMTKMRPKRGAKRSHRKNERDPCRRRPMYVDFKDVGWNDWIVAPLGFDAFYCWGDCEYPMPEHMNTTNHAIVQSLVNSVDPSKVPKPCCVPTQLSSMSMLYVGSDHHNVILKNYKDMVVEGCGCR